MVNKEPTAEESKNNKYQIIELLKECSQENMDKDSKNPTRFTSKGSNFDNKRHLNNNSIDFIKSIGWMNENKQISHARYYSRHFESGHNSSFTKKYDWNKNKSQW